MKASSIRLLCMLYVCINDDEKKYEKWQFENKKHTMFTTNQTIVLLQDKDEINFFLKKQVFCVFVIIIT